MRDPTTVLLALQQGAQGAAGGASWPLIGWAFVSFGFGAVVGVSEILSRYRDEPLQTAFSRYGLVYLALNGIVSVVAFLVLDHYAEGIFPGLAGDLFLTSVVAGFGAMAVLRSKIFTFRGSDGAEYAIGPAIVVETVLQTIDRKIDRQRATERLALVFGSLSGLTDFEATAQYLEASLLSFQNLTTDDKAEIADIIDQYRGQREWPPSLRIMAVGFAFLTIAGEDNFGRVVDSLKRFLGSGSESGSSER